jgi:hypothetical protein
MVLVLVKPFVAIISQQFVLAKGCIHKAIHKRGGQVHSGRVHLRATSSKPCTKGRGKERSLRKGQEYRTISGSEVAP